MKMPIRPENHHKTISEEKVAQVLAQRHAETEPEESDKMRMISLKVPENLLRRCDKMAKAKSLTRSGFIKLALSDYLEAIENKKSSL